MDPSKTLKKQLTPAQGVIKPISMAAPLGGTRDHREAQNKGERELKKVRRHEEWMKRGRRKGGMDKKRQEEERHVKGR